MEYAYKPTTHGRAVMAACMATESPFKITRVAFGSGRVSEETNLADVHELVCYVTDGAISNRSHKNDRLQMTLQFANSEHKDVKTFLLSEFMVYVNDPVSGEETDLLYGTLGDYRQPVPGYNPAFPASVFNFPLELILSDELQVNIAATVGLVTYEDLADILNQLCIRVIGLSIPVEGWDNTGSGRYPYKRDVTVESALFDMVPFVTVLEESEETAEDCGLAPRANTDEGIITFRAVAPPKKAIAVNVSMLRDSTGIVMITQSESIDLPLATEETPGLVKPGPGLWVAEDGTLSVNVTEPDEVEEMLDELGKEV